MADESPERLRQHRLDKLAATREAGIEPYVPQFRRTHTATDARAAADAAPARLEEGGAPLTVTVAGRLMARRSAFGTLEDSTGRIQLLVHKDFLGTPLDGAAPDPDAPLAGKPGYKRWEKLFNIGDIIGATGELFTTKTGELTVRVRELTMLTKSLQMLPEKWHGLKDKELRYRQRYVDLIANPEVRAAFRTRSTILSTLRRAFEARGYIEVETPVLQPIPGGALARPFRTHYNALERDMYLRVALELHLKRLIVGGFDKVFEINRCFRNEGLSYRHQPEFTMLESYEAYADYTDIMVLLEETLTEVVQAVCGGPTFTYQGQEITVRPGWPRIALLDAIAEHSGVALHDTDDIAEAKRRTRDLKELDLPPGAGYGKLVDEMLKTFVAPKLIQPTFLIDYPLELSPLAKKHRSKAGLTERFQPYIGGLELGNAFTELNDPLDQRARFEKQQELKAQGDAETHPLDEDFLTALEYGMPPTGGLGIGIDRLVMLLTDSAHIRDVIFFPQLRQEAT